MMLRIICLSKNDQHMEGHSGNIKRSNMSEYPVSVTEKLLSLSLDEEGFPFPVLRRIVQKKTENNFIIAMVSRIQP